MVSLAQLWLPIVLSAVFVFIASSIIHMVLGYHAGDYRQVPKQDEVGDALRPFNIPPGDYMLPRPASMAAMKDQAFVDKMKKGPVVVMTIIQSGAPAMGPQLAQWFLFCLLVSVFAAYIAGRALPPGTPYLCISQLASCTAFAGYALGAIPSSIWYRKAWSTTLKTMFDGLIFAFITGGTLGWLWPR